MLQFVQDYTADDTADQNQSFDYNELLDSNTSGISSQKIDFLQSKHFAKPQKEVKKMTKPDIDEGPA